jgi:hypothetical protein
VLDEGFVVGVLSVCGLASWAAAQTALTYQKPLGQSLEMYRALRQQGVSVQLLQYPRDNHGPLGSNMYGFPSTEPWHGFDSRRRLVLFIKAAFDKSGGS